VIAHPETIAQATAQFFNSRKCGFFQQRNRPVYGPSQAKRTGPTVFSDSSLPIMMDLRRNYRSPQTSHKLTSGPPTDSSMVHDYSDQLRPKLSRTLWSAAAELMTGSLSRQAAQGIRASVQA